MSDWIIDRAPTRADGDSDGNVLVRMKPNSPAPMDFHWAYVKPGTPWRRTMLWEAPKPAAPASQPRRFASLTTLDGGDALAAVADDGTAWYLNSKWTEWTQLPALPDLEPESHSEN